MSNPPGVRTHGYQHAKQFSISLASPTKVIPSALATDDSYVFPPMLQYPQNNFESPQNKKLFNLTTAIASSAGKNSAFIKAPSPATTPSTQDRMFSFNANQHYFQSQSSAEKQQQQQQQLQFQQQQQQQHSSQHQQQLQQSSKNDNNSSNKARMITYPSSGYAGVIPVKATKPTASVLGKTLKPLFHRYQQHQQQQQQQQQQLQQSQQQQQQQQKSNDINLNASIHHPLVLSPSKKGATKYQQLNSSTEVVVLDQLRESSFEIQKCKTEQLGLQFDYQQQQQQQSSSSSEYTYISKPRMPQDLLRKSHQNPITINTQSSPTNNIYLLPSQNDPALISEIATIFHNLDNKSSDGYAQLQKNSESIANTEPAAAAVLINPNSPYKTTALNSRRKRVVSASQNLRLQEEMFYRRATPMKYVKSPTLNKNNLRVATIETDWSQITVAEDNHMRSNKKRLMSIRGDSIAEAAGGGGGWSTIEEQNSDQYVKYSQEVLDLSQIPQAKRHSLLVSLNNQPRKQTPQRIIVVESDDTNSSSSLTDQLTESSNVINEKMPTGSERKSGVRQNQVQRNLSNNSNSNTIFRLSSLRARVKSKLTRKQCDEKLQQIVWKCTDKTYSDPIGDRQRDENEHQLKQQQNQSVQQSLIQSERRVLTQQPQNRGRALLESQNVDSRFTRQNHHYVQSLSPLKVPQHQQQQQIASTIHAKTQGSRDKSTNQINDSIADDDDDDDEGGDSCDDDEDDDDVDEDDEPSDQMLAAQIESVQANSELCSSTYRPAVLSGNSYAKLMMLKSVYDNRPSTVFFPYPHQCGGVVRDASRSVFVSDYEEKRFDMRFKVTTNSLNLCVGHAFQYAGVRETEDSDWNVCWGTGRDNRIRSMVKFQKTNHFPECWNMGRKDSLWKNLSRVKRKFPSEYDFIPNTYILKHEIDWERFLAKRDDAERGKLWIMKPSNQAQGKNIKMISKKSRVQRKQEYIICEYVANPHLIDGLKYDLRIYVLVTSYDPLRVYIFDDGLTRFATEKYSTNAKELSKRYVHLTNYSLNKNNPKFKQNENAADDSVGSKWSLQALFRKYREIGVDVDTLWARIKDIIVKTCIAAEPYMLNTYAKCEEHRTNCFELYGFDVLVDDTLKPWLLEVNVRPSLTSSSPLDRKIKHTLVCDTFNLIGLQPFDKKKFEDDVKRRIPGVSKRSGGGVVQSKFLKDLSDLNEDNCIEKLSPEDWNMLFETDEENYRTGHFERIFPVKDKFEQYLQFFEYERYNNLIVKGWLNAPVNFLEKVLPKNSTLNV